MVPDRASADVAAAASGGHERSPHISSLHRPRDRGGWRGMAPDQSPGRIQPAGKNRGALRASAFPLRKRLCYVSTKQGWKSEETLWHDVVLKSPRNGRGLMNYGNTLM